MTEPLTDAMTLSFSGSLAEAARLRSALESALIYIQNIQVPQNMEQAALQVRMGEATIREGIAALASPEARS